MTHDHDPKDDVSNVVRFHKEQWKEMDIMWEDAMRCEDFDDGLLYMMLRSPQGEIAIYEVEEEALMQIDGVDYEILRMHMRIE